MRNDQPPGRTPWFLALALTVLCLMLGSQPAEADDPSDEPTEFHRRTLLITDPRVIEDVNRTTNPCAAIPPALQTWAFGNLMKEISAANDDPAAVTFIKNWLSKFRTTQHVNGEDVAPRDIDKIWNGWAGQDWYLNRVPLRLLAIVNRIDLLRSPLMAGENGGEVRFVFGAVDVSDIKSCTPLDFTVILEFGVRKNGCLDLQQWAQAWTSLANWEPGSPEYNRVLWSLTDSVTMRDPDRAKPNRSAIDHVRTNEFINAPTWEFREFRLTADGELVQDTVTMTPMDSSDPAKTLNGSTELINFLTIIDAEVKAAPQDYWIPRRFPNGRQLLGGMAIGGTTWGKHPPEFAINTCSGCHVGSHGRHAHIDPSNGEISQFLKDELKNVRENVLTELSAKGCAADFLVQKNPASPPRGPALRLVH